MQFERLAATLAPFIEKTVTRFSQCPATQDDLKQEALIALWRVAERYPLTDTEVIRLGVRAVYNAAVSVHRSEQRHRPDRRPTTEGIVEYDRPADADLIDRLLAEARPHDRAVLADLKAGMTPSESADFRGRARCNVSRSIARIRGAAERHSG